MRMQHNTKRDNVKSDVKIAIFITNIADIFFDQHSKLRAVYLQISMNVLKTVISARMVVYASTNMAVTFAIVRWDIMEETVRMVRHECTVPTIDCA